MRRRPRKGAPVRFAPTDGVVAAHPGDQVLGLRFNIEARHGGIVEVDLTNLRPRPLAIAFAGAVRRQAELGGALGARSTIKQHIAAYHRFFAYLRAHSHATTPADLRGQDIDGFEASLEAAGMTPIHRHTVLAKAILALRSIDIDQPSLLDEGLRRRLSYTSAQSAGRSQPRDAYSPFVARQLRDAARADIGKIFRRIGRPLDEAGDSNLRRAVADVEARIAAEGKIDHSDIAFKRLYFMRLRRGLPVSSFSEDVHNRHHLLASDLPPLLTFLSLETGLEIECCKTLTIDCLQHPGPGTIEISYIKRRARGAEQKRLRVRDGGLGTPGGLIRKLIEATGFTRRLLPVECLWVYHYKGRGQLRSGIDHPHELVENWVAGHGIFDDDGRPLHLILSRLRKTHKALWYLKTEGHMARFAVGHTPEIAARHYANIPSLRPLHEATVAEALTEVVAAAGPIVLSPDNESLWRQGADVPVQTDSVSALLDGDQDVWLAACSGFQNSPFAEAGSPCPQPFWGCLECRNAVITARKLPAILAFLNFIEGERAGRSAADWSLKFARAHARITQQILLVFSEGVIAQARSQAAQQPLYLPPGATMSKVALAPSRQELDDRPVLTSAPLKEGVDRSCLSRYGDASWDLGPAVFRENARRCHVTVHFGSIEDASVREAIREFLFARLNVDLPGHRKKLPPASVRQIFNKARRFFEFVHAELGAVDLSRINQQLLDRYARHLAADHTRRPIIVGHLLEVPVDLYAYRDHLPSGGLRFQPWSGRAPARVAGYRHVRENRTPRMPEEVIAPLLAWSIRYVTEFAPDIFAARGELDRLEAHCAKLVGSDQTLDHKQRRDRQRRRLMDYFERRRREERGVPIWGTAHNGTTMRHPETGHVSPPVNSHLLHLQIGTDVRADPGMHIQLAGGAPDLIDAALRVLGVETGGMDTPISTLPETGQPWRPRFDAKTLAQEERMLQSAAYILCAYLTGMRDCEVQAMKRGCLSVARSEDGRIMRHRVRSTAYKGKSTQGEVAEWVTIEAVGRAIEVLERLSFRAASARGLTTLWPVLAAKSVCKDHLSAEIVRQLNRYRDHLNDLFGAFNEPVIPNGPDGEPWRITTRQFRRTIAWHIANRPFGTIAGMIQYKHASVAAFEGYAGSSRSGFRAEVENQRSLGQLDDLLTYFDERQAGATLSGPAAPRISKAVDAAAAELDPLPVMIADRARLRTMLASLARTLHVGVLADCFFDPGTALCLKQATNADNKTPLTALCQPTRCPNACITARHRPTWARSADEARAVLKEKRSSSLQRSALQQDLARIEAVLHDIDCSTDARTPRLVL